MPEKRSCAGKSIVLARRAVLLAASLALTVEAKAAELDQVVANAVKPVMAQYAIPGMAVGVIHHGETHFFSYGVASIASHMPVTGATLFEIGSVSKTLAATLASYAAVTGKLSLSDSPGRYLTELQGSKLDAVSLINLGTHTPGGFPLQLPGDIVSDADLTAYFKSWQPAYAPGTTRTYANPSVGLLGLVAAKSLGRDYTALVQGTLLPALGLSHTYLTIPKAERGNYAEGYTEDGTPIRMGSSVIAAEAYGIRTTSGDLTRWVAANIGLLKLDSDIEHAVVATHTGYYRVGAMTQDLIWEQYSYPVALSDLVEGNSAKISQHPNAVEAITPPLPPQSDVWINKTGSTNGFSTYVAFVPQQKLGIVLLANKEVPSAARVTAAYTILTALGGEGRK
jgi:beta-lactamase class C